MNSAAAAGHKAKDDGTDFVVGPLLVRLRREAGRTQAAQAEVLTRLAGTLITRYEITRWEHERRLPGAYWRPYLAKSFGVPLAEIEAAVTTSRKQRRRRRQVAKGRSSS